MSREMLAKFSGLCNLIYDIYIYIYIYIYINSHQKITMTHTQTTCPNHIALRTCKKRGVSCWGWTPGLRVQKISSKKLLKCNCTIQIAKFNVRTLNRISQQPELTASVIDHNIDIICIEKHRYTHSEDIKYHDTGNDWTLATASSEKNSLSATIGCVGMLIGPRALKSQNGIKKIQSRMMVATFNGYPNAKIISCYSPSNVNKETDLIAFYNELSNLVRSIPKHNVLVTGRDMNAHIGKNVNPKFSLHNSSNRNGEHITDFTLENRLILILIMIINTQY